MIIQARIIVYYIDLAINIEWIKCVITSKRASMQLSRDIGMLTRYCTLRSLRKLPLHDIGFDDVIGQLRRATIGQASRHAQNFR